MRLAPLLVAFLPLMRVPGATDGRSDLEQGVAALSRLLVHPDEHVREAAADGLRALGPAVELAFPALLEAIAAGGGPRETAGAMVGRLGPRAASLVPGLVAFGRGGDPAARSCATGLLLSLSPWIRGAEGFLVESMASTTGATREQAARALLIADPTRAAARDLLAVAIRDGSIERDVRIAAALGRAGLDAPLATWIVRALGDDEVANRRFAEEALAHVDGRSTAAVAPLQQGLLSDDSEIQNLCAEALGRIGPGAKEAREPLAHLLAAPVASVRYAAARALARMQPGHAGTAEQLLAALDGDAEYQDELAGALCELEPEVAARALAERFDRGDEKVKQRAVRLAALLIDQRDRERVDSLGTAAEMRSFLRARALADVGRALLERATKAAEPAVRRAAIAAVGRRFDAAARTPLVLAALADPDAGVRGEALALGGPANEAPAELAPGLRALPAEGDPAVAARGATTLAALLADEGAAQHGVNAGEPARFSADELIELCVGSPESELEGFALRDAEIVLLLDVASGPDEGRGRLAARALARSTGPLPAELLARVGKALESGPPWAKVAAARLLDRDHADSKTATPQLVRVLGDEEALTTAATGALVTHGVAAVPPLLAALDDPSEPSRPRRLAAVRALGILEFQARAALPRLLEMVGDEDDELTIEVAFSIEHIVTGGRLGRLLLEVGERPRGR